MPKIFVMKFVKVVVALLTVLISLGISADAAAPMDKPVYCYATDTVRPMVHMAAVSTSYEAIRRFHFSAVVNPHGSERPPSKIWYLGRYGTRIFQTPTIQSAVNFAESSIQDDIISNYEGGRTNLCRQDYELIRDYLGLESNFGKLLRPENAEMVTAAGILALQNIARRYQQVFPDILTETYHPHRFHFRYTSTQRLNESIHAFATGLFGEAEAANVVYEPMPVLDWLLRPLEFCPAYKEDVINGSRRRDAFANGHEIQRMVDEINSNLGFHGSSRMNFSVIFTMWTWCRFEVASTFETSGSKIGDDSPWCVPFLTAHHRLLEYYIDLGLFDLYGYGVSNQRLLQNLNCGRIQDMVRHMQSENDHNPIARILFTNSDEMLAMLTALGAFRDLCPLTEHNFARQYDRHWKTSFIQPFSANIAVVRFDRDDGDHDLHFLLDEKPLLLPGCDKNGVCKLSVISNQFRRFIDADCSTFFCSNN